MTQLPPFNERGLLPSGDYVLSFEQLRDSILVNGTGENPNWDHSWRLYLVNQCEIMVRQLWEIGISGIFLDGSFVEDKAHPNDIDGYFVCDAFYLASGHLERDLNALDPYKIWTWDPRSRRPHQGSSKKQLPMWHRYRVELFPHFGQSSGIRDEHGHELQFPAAFRKQRGSYEPKGIVQIVK